MTNENRREGRRGREVEAWKERVKRKKRGPVKSEVEVGIRERRLW